MNPARHSTLATVPRSHAEPNTPLRLFGCAATIPLPTDAADMPALIGRVCAVFAAVQGASVTLHSADDRVRLRLYCPAQPCTAAFIAHCRDCLSDLAAMALEGFAVELNVGGQRTVEWFGPTPAEAALARRNARIEQAADGLQSIGLDLYRLLEVVLAASRLADALTKSIGSGHAPEPNRLTDSKLRERHQALVAQLQNLRSPR